MAITDALKSFVEQVRKSTEDGRIPWDEGAEENEFIAAMPGGSLRISSWWNREDGFDIYTLSILNDEGKLVDRVSTDSGAEYGPLTAILDGARRKARNADKIIRTMMDDMK